MTDTHWPPVTPGDVLKAKFCEPPGLSNYRLAKELGVSESKVGRVVNGQTAVTIDMADRLAQRFGTTVKFWLNLQMRLDEATHESQPIPYFTSHPA